MMELQATLEAHARFQYLDEVYKQHVLNAEQTTGDVEQVTYHGVYTIRAYMLYLVGTTIFVDKSATYVDVVYLRYFDDFEGIHEYNWGGGLIWYTCTLS